MEPETSLSVEVEPGPPPTALIRLVGELDASNAGQVDERGAELVAAGFHDLVVDCAGLTFCDSAGVHALLVLHTAVQPDGSLTVARPRDAVERLLRVTRLDARIGVRADLPEPWSSPQA